MALYPSTRRPAAIGVVFMVLGGIGWFAAFMLLIDKILVLENPGVDLDCNLSVLVQCSKNLGSWQGAVLGFPNPILGVAGFVAPIAVGLALISGARFARWFWVMFTIGVTAAFCFCLWLAYQSIFDLGTLCPWCMTVWAATTPLFFAVTLFSAKIGVFGVRARRTGSALLGWVPALSVGVYLIIAIVAQLRLDVIATL